MAALDDFDTILAAAKQGDQRAASQLFRAFHPPLLRYLRFQEREAAEDIAAEVWLAAAGFLAEFEGDASGYQSWLFTVARRRLIEYRRRRQRRRTDAVDPVEFESNHAPEDTARSASDAVDAEKAIELMAEFLSPEQSEVLILRVVADLSAAQVGEMMGRPESWVRLTQHRALNRLASHLDTRMEATR